VSYRPKSKTFEAFRYSVDPEPNWFKTCVEQGWAEPRSEGVVLRINYNHNLQFVLKGDWVVQGYNGIPYGVYDDDFHRMFEPCE